MTTFERVYELKQQGIPENEIIRRLQNEGIQPMQITDALDQTKIKNAINKDTGNNMESSIMYQNDQEQKTQDYGAYIPQNQNAPPENVPTPTGAQEQPPSPEEHYAPEETYNEYPEPEEQYYEQPTGEEGYEQAYNEGGAGYQTSDTIIEVAEQVFKEKTKKINKDIRALNEFKTIYSSKIDDMHERLKRIEKQFDKMQIAILDKVGSFGKHIDKLQKEINMVEDSMEKINRK